MSEYTEILKVLEILTQKTANIESNMVTKAELSTTIANVEAKMVTKDEFNSAIAKLATREELHQAIAEQQKDVMAMLQIMDKKLHSVQENQVIQGESINILTLRQLQSESEIAVLKKAKLSRETTNGFAEYKTTDCT